MERKWTGRRNKAERNWWLEFDDANDDEDDYENENGDDSVDFLPGWACQ